MDKYNRVCLIRDGFKKCFQERRPYGFFKKDLERLEKLCDDSTINLIRNLENEVWNEINNLEVEIIEYKDILTSEGITDIVLDLKVDERFKDFQDCLKKVQLSLEKIIDGIPFFWDYNTVLLYRKFPEVFTIETLNETLNITADQLKDRFGDILYYFESQRWDYMDLGHLEIIKSLLYKIQIEHQESYYKKWLEKMKDSKNELASLLELKDEYDEQWIIDCKEINYYDDDILITTRYALVYKDSFIWKNATTDKIEELFKFYTDRQKRDSDSTWNSNLSWTGKDIELFELIRVLFKSGKISMNGKKIKQKELIDVFSKLLPAHNLNKDNFQNALKQGLNTFKRSEDGEFFMTELLHLIENDNLIDKN